MLTEKGNVDSLKLVLNFKLYKRMWIIAIFTSFHKIESYPKFTCIHDHVFTEERVPETGMRGSRRICQRGSNMD